MEKIIIIKYGELSTKKDNKNFFISKLKNNIDVTLKNIEHENAGVLRFGVHRHFFT